MNFIDLFVLTFTLLSIVGYGVWKTKGQKNLNQYLLAGNSMKWGTIGLSVMATQASAITFISTPGQAYESGMGFIQNYLGLPLALIVVSSVFIPMYYKFKVYTAYEFLEKRFDLKVRLLSAFLFLLQRGFATGITIYAPGIILSSILDWNLNLTILLTGLLVMLYTVMGGSKAVSVTQKQQMLIILFGIFLTFGIIIYYILEFLRFEDALLIAGNLEKLDAINLNLDFSERYTVWSGITGGFFLALSYFGTDQSQVQRYLGGKNMTESKIGLMFNALVKIPMQFFILFLGVMLYVFFILYPPPIHFKKDNVDLINSSVYQPQFQEVEKRYGLLADERKNLASSLENEANNFSKKGEIMTKIKRVDGEINMLRIEIKQMIEKIDPSASSEDSDFIFLNFILHYLPHGLIGLLIAVILSAAMSSTSSELNALASTTSVDFYKRLFNKNGNEKHYVRCSKLFTFLWGIIAISFALMAHNSENLIEAVNIIGSLFYGTILGIFLVAFFIKKCTSTQVFYAAIFSQLVVFLLHYLNLSGTITLGYLWYNVISCAILLISSYLINCGRKRS